MTTALTAEKVRLEVDEGVGHTRLGQFLFFSALSLYLINSAATFSGHLVDKSVAQNNLLQFEKSAHELCLSLKQEGGLNLQLARGVEAEVRTVYVDGKLVDQIPMIVEKHQIVPSDILQNRFDRLESRVGQAIEMSDKVLPSVEVWTTINGTVTQQKIGATSKLAEWLDGVRETTNRLFHKPCLGGLMKLIGDTFIPTAQNPPDKPAPEGYLALKTGSQGSAKLTANL